MTNEERAREAAEAIGEHLHVFWTSERRAHVEEAESIILAALAAATASLVAERERAEKERDRFREELRYACAALMGAASAYRAHAGRSGHIRPRSRPDPFFLTRVSDMDKAAEQARAALAKKDPSNG